MTTSAEITNYEAMCSLRKRVERLERAIKEHKELDLFTATYPHEGNKWSQFEKELLHEHIQATIQAMSLETGRSPNAIIWAIYKYVKERRQ